MLSRMIKLSGSFFVVTIFTIVSFGFFPLIANASGEPDVTTRRATYVTSDSAVLKGSVDGNNRSATAWFEYGTTTNFNYRTSRESFDGDNDEDYEADIFGLFPNTIYYFRAVARNSRGTDYGNTFSFRTSPDYYNNYPSNYSNINYYGQPNYYPQSTTSPTAVTMPATEIWDNNAQLNSLIIAGNDSSNSWFEWGTNQNLGNKTITMPVGSLEAIRHAHTLTGLVPGVTYYFRAVAENSSWRSNGPILSFVAIGTSNVRQNTNTIVIIEEPVSSVPAITTTTEKIPAENKTAIVSLLGANVFGVGSFFPGNIIGWLILLILVLILILLVKHPQVGLRENKKDKEHVSN